MVKFLRRKLNRRYKGKDHEYVRYLLEFPVKLNGKLASHSGKVFDEIEIASTETGTKEVLNIALVRKKPKPPEGTVSNSPPAT
jgi:hypothetical protein